MFSAYKVLSRFSVRKLNIFEIHKTAIIMQQKSNGKATY